MVEAKVELTRRQAFDLGKSLIGSTNMNSRYKGKKIVLYFDETGEVSVLEEGLHE
jgi:hypothetical protein